MISLESIDRELSKREGIAAHIAQELDRVGSVIHNAKQHAIDLEEAQLIIQEVARRTQEQLEYRLSELTTLALETVFPDPYRLRVKFENKRGRTEASLMFEDGEGHLIDPMSASGCGPVDVAALALRLTLLCSTRPRPRPVVILDEPFRYVSADLQPRVRQMLREVADRLKVQFIIITHDWELAEVANRVFRVRKVAGASVVTVDPSQSSANPTETPVLRTNGANPLPLPPPAPVTPLKRLKRMR